MSRFDEADDPRRRLLIQALAAGAFATVAPSRHSEASVFGDVPRQMPAGRSIYRLNGDVRVNNKPATIETVIRPNDTVETSPGGEIVFVVGKDSYILRGGSRLVLQADKAESSIASTLRILAGRILAVFGRGAHRIETTTAVVGIRGTGIYAEADPEQTYFCTCYGLADIAATKDKTSRETVQSKHHDRPLYILANAPAGKNLRRAPMINHTDTELTLVETLVGRTPPFVFPGDDYKAPRREY